MNGKADNGTSPAGMKPVMVPDLAPPTEEMEALSHIILPSLLEVKAYFEKEGYFALQKG